MENASQALIIAGAILLAILIIAIGMYIYNAANANIINSVGQISTQDIESFNSQFESYRGKQSGAQVSALMGKLIANASSNSDETARVPNITIVNNKLKGGDTGTTNLTVNYNNSTDDEKNNYVANLSSFKNRVETRHTYTVEFDYATNSLISSIIITY